jgi:hypothetical protein
MIATAVEPKAWPRRRWWLLLALVFTGQLALIFVLSDRRPLQVRPPAPAPVLHLAGSASAGMMALWDPTLFALPHRQGFSAIAWTVNPPQETRSPSPPEPLEYLALADQPLGADFNRLVATNRFEFAPARPEAPLPLALPTLFSPPTMPAPSTVRVEGALAERRLLTPIEPPSWPHTEMLSNSIVQIVVDADGRTVSPGALLSLSGAMEADQFALKLARAARFEPVKPAGPDQAANKASPLTWGKLIFEWQTVPVPTSNVPSGTPPP